MASFALSDSSRLRSILEIFSFLDDARWQAKSNYNLINYYTATLTPQDKLLTHWLCYISDRQTAFQRVWDIGGYVISHLVHEYAQDRTRSVREILDAHTKKNSDGKTRLKAPIQGKNKILARYEFDDKTEVDFAARYMPEDLVRIFRTLLVLDKHYNRNFGEFIVKAMKDEPDHKQVIPKIASALNLLTYAHIGQVPETSLLARMEEQAEKAGEFSLKASSTQDLSGRKRMWCALRDFLKSPEFNPEFVSAVRQAGLQTADDWKKDNPVLKNALSALELPGDVWNNNKVFRQGLFSPYLRDETSWKMPRIVREIFKILERDGVRVFYPEQLDITFDFVPRMCERKMCRICPFGDGITNLCHQNGKYLCPVALATCGYELKCAPQHCPLKDDSTKGYCQERIKTNAQE